MTKALGLSSMARFAGLAPLLVRVIVGIIMTAHGWQKLTQMGPAGFGQVLGQMGVPLPGLMGFVVTFVELLGGILLIVGLLSRLAALLLTIDLRRDPAGEGQRRVDSALGCPRGRRGTGPGAHRGAAGDPAGRPRQTLAGLRARCRKGRGRGANYCLTMSRGGAPGAGPGSRRRGPRRPSATR